MNEFTTVEPIVVRAQCVLTDFGRFFNFNFTLHPNGLLSNKLVNKPLVSFKNSRCKYISKNITQYAPKIFKIVENMYENINVFLAIFNIL